MPSDPASMTTVELLRDAAVLLQDFDEDETVAALRARADRLEAALEFWCGRGTGDRTPWDILREVNAPDASPQMDTVEREPT